MIKRFELTPWNVWRISHRYRFAVCSTPRCGSTSLDGWFTQIEPGAFRSGCEGDWFSEAQLRKIHREYSTLILIRDPWSRLVSAYLGKIVAHQGLVNGRHLVETVQDLLGQPRDPEAGITFRQFVYATRLFTNDHWRPICEFAPWPVAYECTPIGLSMMIARLSEILRPPSVEFPRLNAFEYGERVEDAMEMRPADLRALPKFPRWDSFYNLDLQTEIGERYKQDIERFALTWDRAIKESGI